MNQSQVLFEKAQKLIPGGVNSPVRAFRSVVDLLFTKQAKGAKLTTADDQELSTMSAPGVLLFMVTIILKSGRRLQMHLRKAPALALRDQPKWKWPN